MHIEIMPLGGVSHRDDSGVRAHCWYDWNFKVKEALHGKALCSYLGTTWFDSWPRHCCPGFSQFQTKGRTQLGYKHFLTHPF
jgi:hypothetical protein